MTQLFEKKIKVLVVDDSALVRQILKTGLDQYPGLEVVGTAVDPYEARDKIVTLKPDVLTLDVEMPKMDGVEFLKKLMPQYPIPVVMVSALTEKGKRITMEALAAGAIDFVTKPSTSVSAKLGEMMGELAQKVIMASQANVSHWKSRKSPPVGNISNKLVNYDFTQKVIAIGASTGGTEAIKTVLKDLPTNIPGIVIVQHMPPGYVAAFAKNVDNQCNIVVREAQDRDKIKPGCALIAPGGKHLKVQRNGDHFIVRVFSGEKVSGHSPSVDVMMTSVATEVGDKAYGVILTGMGRDGADGLLKMYKAGAKTFAQNEETCIVYGMPKVAYQYGAVQQVLPVELIAEALLDSMAV